MCDRTDLCFCVATILEYVGWSSAVTDGVVGIVGCSVNGGDSVWKSGGFVAGGQCGFGGSVFDQNLP